MIVNSIFIRVVFFLQTKHGIDKVCTDLNCDAGNHVPYTGNNRRLLQEPVGNEFSIRQSNGKKI